MLTTQLETDNPYVGPRTFTQDQRNLFFGREREARALLSRVVAERLVLFYAQSGAGKSSLLNARLIPWIKEQARYLVLPIGRVGGELPDGMDGIANVYVFNLLLSLDDSSQDPGKLLHRFAEMRMSDFLAGLRTPDGEHYYYDAAVAQRLHQQDLPPSTQDQPPHLLIIDQFEEIVTTHPTRWSERRDFFVQLGDAMRADPQLWVLLTLREDYVAALDPYARLLPGDLRSRFYMQRMEVDAALEAVREPARFGRRPFAPTVAEKLVDNLRQIRTQGDTQSHLGQYVEPVQLQVVCYQLWENLKQHPLGPITDTDLQEAGDVDTALADFYEEALADVLTRAEGTISERQIRDWFETNLITEAGTRGSAFQGDAQTAGMPNHVVALLQNRFLLRAELRSGGTWIELIHDRFVGPIQQANQQRRPPFARDAQAWLAAGRDPNRLYTGRQLQLAEQEVKDRPDSFSKEEREFIEAAAEAAALRNRQLRHMVTAGSILLATLLLSLTAWALWSSGQATTQAANAEIARQTAIAGANNAATAEALAVTQAAVAAAAQATAATEAQIAEGLRARAIEAMATANSDRQTALEDQAELALNLQISLTSQAVAYSAAQAARATLEAVLNTGTTFPSLTVRPSTPTPDVADTELTATAVAVQTQLARIEATQTVVAYQNAIVLDLPFAGNYLISQLFGENPEFYSQITYDGVALRGHNGLDFAIPVGTQVLAVDAGTVLSAVTDNLMYGNYILLEHAWGESFYAQLSELRVQEGKFVEQGQVIGTSGNTGASTGPHLHLGIRISPYDRADGYGGFSDPLPYLQDALAHTTPTP